MFSLLTVCIFPSEDTGHCAHPGIFLRQEQAQWLPTEWATGLGSATRETVRGAVGVLRVLERCSLRPLLLQDTTTGRGFFVSDAEFDPFSHKLRMKRGLT